MSGCVLILDSDWLCVGGGYRLAVCWWWSMTVLMVVNGCVLMVDIDWLCVDGGQWLCVDGGH